ncbi:MAG: helix-turn-helix transcriptional regulator [Candidatus Gastranaerophilaceae bacterium]
MNTKILNKLGGRIKELRKEQNLTQEILAEKLNVHQTYIGKPETGKSNPSFMLIYRMSKVLKVNLHEFFKFDG